MNPHAQGLQDYSELSKTILKVFEVGQRSARNQNLQSRAKAPPKKQSHAQTQGAKTLLSCASAAVLAAALVLELLAQRFGVLRLDEVAGEDLLELAQAHGLVDGHQQAHDHL